MEEIAGKLAISVKGEAGTITHNLAELREYVEKQLEIYEGWEPDAGNEEDVAQAKNHRTFLRKMKKDINEQRIAIEREWNKPLQEFKSEVNAICNRIDLIDDVFTDVIYKAEESRKAEKYAQLQEHYNEFAGLLAPVVPYERIHVEAWLNKTCSLKKAFEQMEDGVSQIALDHANLMSQQLFCKQDTEAVFFRTLSLSDALRYDAERRANQERIDAMKAEQEQYRQLQDVEPIEQPVEVPVRDQTPEVPVAEPLWEVTCTVNADMLRQLTSWCKVVGIHGKIRRVQ